METAGSLIDKLSINELKIYHMMEQQKRDDVSEDFILDCEAKLQILRQQKEDLKEELEQLIEDVTNGKKVFKVYRQMKMYNDKKYKD